MNALSGRSNFLALGFLQNYGTLQLTTALFPLEH
jgi:hypothetical protein